MKRENFQPDDALEQKKISAQQSTLGFTPWAAILTFDPAAGFPIGRQFRQRLFSWGSNETRFAARQAAYARDLDRLGTNVVADAVSVNKQDDPAQRIWLMLRP